MSKNIKKSSTKEGCEVSMKDAEEPMEKFRMRKKENVDFEVKYFMISLAILFNTNIYIHKTNVNNYNFKIIFLTVMYFARRLIIQLWYHYRVREHLILSTNKVLFVVVCVQMGMNILYIFWDLMLNYSVYSLLPLFYLSLLQIPMFRLDIDKRYENAPKEMMRSFKKISFLSLEICYYGIFIPVFFSMKYSPFLNMFAIIIYTFFTWINCAVFLFAFHYYKKSAEFYFHTKVFGSWKRIRKADIPGEKFQKIKPWVYQAYEKDAIVEYKGKYYVGLEERNYIEPTNIYANLLYMLFSNPKKIFWAILFFQGCFTVFQLVFYLLTQLNMFSLNLSIMSWYIFYTIYKISKKVKFIFNK